MYYYKILIAYDGYDYHGWQWQPTKKAVANQLEKSFKKAFIKSPYRLWVPRAQTPVCMRGDK